ncbi:MAG: FAD-dependent oxidoreductase [Microbacteriaceae bacterium]|nr:FAD-dependent oxidoreductase [Microbacteriaceae bacterium]
MRETGSLWAATAGERASHDPLPGDRDVDVAIVGGGLTGLWTAWYLLQRDPGIRVAVLEREHLGFGASGRNGGWCSALFPQSANALERRHGRDAALRMRRAMIDTVDEVARAGASAGADFDYAKGGTVLYARNAAQLRAARSDVADAAGYGVDALELWGPERVRAAGTRRGTAALGAAFDPDCARLHPAKLVRGLAAALGARGVQLYERTNVLSWAPGPSTRSARAGGRGVRPSVLTDRGTVTADAVVIATEAYGAAIRRTHRRVLPMYSLMIATEPLPDAVWDEIGIAHGQTFADYRHLIVYGQRTADNRFAFGGRGAPYHFGSRISPAYDRVPRVFRHLAATLRELFPQLPDLAVTHAWGGPLGIPRDWHAHVAYDPVSGIASAGGYVGDGLSTTNLAGRTLADLVTGTASELTTLPWVGHRSPDWEVEPLRWLATNAGTLAMDLADREEALTGCPSLIARLVGPLTGH